MDYVVIIFVSLFASALTLFSGFGLGTILMPVFALFFPIDIAIAMTAIVHFSNNIIKISLFRKHINWNIVLRFGFPSILSAFAGAYLLKIMSELPDIGNYSILDKVFYISPIKLTIALLLVFFSLMDLLPKLKGLQFDKKYLPIGGLLSGFFGGLSGHQGALRTTFLIKAGLSKEAFIASGVAIACLIDISRLSIYSSGLNGQFDKHKLGILIVAVSSAFLGVYLGNKLFRKITISHLQNFVAAMLLTFSILLGLGIV